jgi:hypothetical protein
LPVRWQGFVRLRLPPSGRKLHKKELTAWQQQLDG